MYSGIAIDKNKALTAIRYDDLKSVAAGAKNKCWGGGVAQTNWKYGRSGPSSLIFFFLHPNALWRVFL